MEASVLKEENPMTENIKPAVDTPKAVNPAPVPVPVAPPAKVKAVVAKGPWGEVRHIEASGTIFAHATQIESAGPWTIVNIQSVRHLGAGLDQQGVILPIDAAIGDLVELYVNGYTGRVFTPEGDSFVLTDENASVDVGSSAMFRKVTEKGWRYVAGS